MIVPASSKFNKIVKCDALCFDSLLFYDPMKLRRYSRLNYIRSLNLRKLVSKVLTRFSREENLGRKKQ